MKKMLFPLAFIITLSACKRTPRTEITDNNPKKCWACTQYVRTSSTSGVNITTKKDSVFCDKTGVEMSAIMADRDTGTLSIGGFKITNIKSVEDCKVK